MIDNLYQADKDFKILDSLHPRNEKPKNDKKDGKDKDDKPAGAAPGKPPRKAWSTRPEPFKSSLGETLDEAENTRCMRESLCKKCRKPGHRL